MMEQFSYTLKVPRDRVGVLIGKKGEIKKHVEEATGTVMEIDSKEGDVVITAIDGLKLYEAREVVRAIARGFNPKTALQLLKGDYALEVVNIADYVGKNQNAGLRLKGRVIGAEGKAKREIERLTNSEISVYGKTVAIIAEIENAMNARRAIQNLLEGATHASVYHFLERKRRERRVARIVGEEDNFSG